MNKVKITSALVLCIIVAAVGFFILKSNRKEIRHIVLISMDTTRADYFSCYGYPNETTPNIDTFAKEASRFEHVVAPAPITLPSHSTMLTGLIPPSHGVHYNHAQLPESTQTLPEILKQEGFNTAAIVSAFVLYKQFGLSQGFDSYNDTFKKQHGNARGKERKGDETTQLALDWLDTNKDEKNFLFLHYYDPHYQYAPPEPYASNFPDSPYAGEIAFTDHCIGRVIQKLKDLKIYDSTLLIITGDHGEMLGEHGEQTHTYFIYESAIRVPLLIRQPGQKKGSTISAPVGIVDITPTICSLLDIEMPASVQGFDISPLMQNNIPEDYERFIYSESVGPNRFGASSLMAVSSGKWKYIQAPRPELYDLEADPGEKNNLVQEKPQRARILEDHLKEILEKSVSKNSDSSIELDAESLKRLESLGYVAGKSDGELVFDEDKEDPKDIIHIVTQFEQAGALMDKQEYAKARKMFEALIPQRPEFHEIYKQLGDICKFQQQDDQAIKYYRQCYELDPMSITYPLLNDLAWIQATRPSLSSRDVNEAVKYAEDACERSKFKDPGSLDTLAVAYAAVGDFEKAVEFAKKAVWMARSSKNTAMAKDIAERLELFEQSKPYIEESPEKQDQSKRNDLSLAIPAGVSCCP